MKRNNSYQGNYDSYDEIFKSYNGNYVQKNNNHNFGKILFKVFLVFFLMLAIVGVSYAGYLLVNKYVLNKKTIDVNLITTNLELKVGEQKKLEFAIKDSKDVSLIRFESTNTKVAIVDSTGTVIATGIGVVSIVLRYEGNNGKDFKVCTVQVNAPYTPTPEPTPIPTPIPTPTLEPTSTPINKNYYRTPYIKYNKPSQSDIEKSINAAKEAAKKAQQNKSN